MRLTNLLRLVSRLGFRPLGLGLLGFLSFDASSLLRGSARRVWPLFLLFLFVTGCTWQWGAYSHLCPTITCEPTPVNAVCIEVEDLECPGGDTTDFSMPSVDWDEVIQLPYTPDGDN